MTDNAVVSIDNFIMTELHEAAERAGKKVRDRDAMRRACIQLDVAREELRKRVGTLNVAVDLIRSGRDQ
jgi:antirestriction protein ArdC